MIDWRSLLFFVMGMTRDPKVQDILSRYAAGERDFRNLELDDRTYDFADSDLRGAIFTGSYIYASFRNADLRGADFSRCNVKTCDFSGARLTDATFYESAVDAADFDGADLSGANFEEASAFGYVFAQGELPPH